MSEYEVQPGHKSPLKQLGSTGEKERWVSSALLAHDPPGITVTVDPENPWDPDINLAEARRRLRVVRDSDVSTKPDPTCPWCRSDGLACLCHGAHAAPRTRVVNLRNEPYDVYIGRAGQGQDGYFGNPIRHGVLCPQCGRVHPDRAATIPCFRAYFGKRFANDPEFRRRVSELRGKTLGCFCAPAACHGNVYVEALESGHVPVAPAKPSSPVLPVLDKPSFMPSSDCPVPKRSR